MFFDPLYIIMLAPVLLFSMWASSRVKKNFKHYSRYGVYSGLTGAEAARRILEANGINNIPITKGSGWLSDHYSPSEKVIRLSPDVYGSSSIAAIGVAAHEAGHALQHRQGYAVMGLWQMLAKPASIGSNMAYILIIAGMLLGILGLAKIGLVLFGVVVLFQIVTLPLEFNASSRARQQIVTHGIVSREEAAGVARVLNAAALTYIAAAAASIVTLLYYVIRLGLLSDR